MSSIERAIEMLKQGESVEAVAEGVRSLGADPQQQTDTDLTIERASARTVETAAAPRDAFLYQFNFPALRERGFLTPDQAQSRLAEEYRVIKRPVLANAFGEGAAPLEHGNLIMVTSALSGEGKTFTSLNLAMSMASELDNTVLLIDADVVKPSLTRLLGLHDRPGLIDLLLDGNLDVPDVMVSTNIPKLRIIPAGRTHGHSTELLASDQMRQLAEGLATRYADRVVLFDAPPLLITTQAHVLSDLTGQILLVVAAGDTPRKAVQEAISQLNNEKAIGLVLNKNSGGLGADYYGGYYGSYEKP